MASVSEASYKSALSDILTMGEDRPDRTGVGTRSIFGMTRIYDVSAAFPLMTSKKMFFNKMVHELIWFINGKTNLKDLDVSVHPWWKDFADENGELGPVYGHNFRRIECDGENAILIKRMIGEEKLPPKITPTKIKWDFIEADEMVGKILTNTSGHDFKILGVISRGKNSTYAIQFLRTGTITHCTRPNARQGLVKDFNEPSACGAGILGQGKIDSEKDDRVYSLWRNMIARCYDESHPNYSVYGGAGAYVSGEWLNFSMFKKSVTQVPFYNKWKMGGAYDLDKDYYGSKCYSEKTCVFIKKEHNLELANSIAVSAVCEKSGKENLYVSQKHASIDLGISEYRVSKYINSEKPVSGFFLRKYESEDFLVRREIVKDQLHWLIEEIKRNPMSRRLVVSAWNVPEIENMALPPCHTLFQVYIHRESKKMDMILHQRSGDMFLGVPYNIASYSLLLMILCKITGNKPGRFIHNIGDAHIYLNHLDQVKKYIDAPSHPLPLVKISDELVELDGILPYMFELQDYKHEAMIAAPLAV